jgi:hypothetical protein
MERFGPLAAPLIFQPGGGLDQREIYSEKHDVSANDSHRLPNKRVSSVARAASICQIDAMSYAQSARSTFSDMLGTLDHLVVKAQDAGIADEVLGEKLTEDMFPLELQFRIALNQVLLALN